MHTHAHTMGLGINRAPLLDDEVLHEAASMYTEAVTRLSEDSLVCVLHSQFLLYVMEKPLLARRSRLTSLVLDSSPSMLLRQLPPFSPSLLVFVLVHYC
jgi:hypothetical protein